MMRRAAVYIPLYRHEMQSWSRVRLFMSEAVNISPDGTLSWRFYGHETERSIIEVKALREDPAVRSTSCSTSLLPRTDQWLYAGPWEQWKVIV